MGDLLSGGRAKAAVGLLVAALAAGGIVIPGLGEEEDPSAPVAASAGFEQEETTEIGRVLAAIESGQPLPYDEDGQTFQNREGLLPSQPLGYYREYTVETPGSPDRGARRLVIGDGGETYYTRDHYASFERIDPAEFVP